MSNDRIMQLEEWMAISACERFDEDGVVVLVYLRKGIFTVAAIDNLGHNPSATTASSSFNRTGINIFQLPSKKWNRTSSIESPTFSSNNISPEILYRCPCSSTANQFCRCTKMSHVISRFMH